MVGVVGVVGAWLVEQQWPRQSMVKRRRISAGNRWKKASSCFESPMAPDSRRNSDGRAYAESNASPENEACAPFDAVLPFDAHVRKAAVQEFARHWFPHANRRASRAPRSGVLHATALGPVPQLRLGGAQPHNPRRGGRASGTERLWGRRHFKHAGRQVLHAFTR